ncbi:hypothetical protein [Peptostreptococcus faecalis]|uniref:hypothetical protein n=1 Tax=Peptostreptococcus faecalis TaxID=2045015 RepID=UPI000C7A05D3|nr:hypothetical protein [Peptostreptococcus faecalis]
MNKDKWKNGIGILIIFLAVFKYYGTYFSLPNMSKYIMIVSLVLATLLIFENRKNYNIIHFAFLGLAGIQFVLSKNITMVYTYYLCLGLFALEFRTVIKWFIIISTALFSIYLLSNILGIHPTEYLEGRNDFGFGNPNTAFISMFMIWSAFFYYIFYSEKKIDFIVLFLMIFLMYTQTMTRTGLLTAILTVVAFIILKLVDVRKKIPSYLIASFPALMSLLSVVITVFLSNNYLINKVLSHRPIYWNSYLMHSSKGINLFGYAPNIRDILFTQRMPLDSGYIWSLYSMGIVVFVALIAMMCYTLYQLCLENKKDEILLIVSILIYCFAESIMVDLPTNIGLILIVYGVSKVRIKSIFPVKKSKRV